MGVALRSFAMDVQNERSYQKQPHIFAGKARLLSRSTRKGARHVKSIGLGFKTPAKAKEGRYIDKKCPFRRPGVHPWQAPSWCRPQDLHEEHHHRASGLPSLPEEVPSLREAP